MRSSRANGLRSTTPFFGAPRIGCRAQTWAASSSSSRENSRRGSTRTAAQCSFPRIAVGCASSDPRHCVRKESEACPRHADQVAAGVFRGRVRCGSSRCLSGCGGPVPGDGRPISRREGSQPPVLFVRCGQDGRRGSAGDFDQREQIRGGFRPVACPRVFRGRPQGFQCGTRSATESFRRAAAIRLSPDPDRIPVCGSLRDPAQGNG